MQARSYVFLCPGKKSPNPGKSRNIIMDTNTLASRPASIVSPGQLVEDIMNKTYVSREQAARRLGLALEELDSFYKGELELTKELAFKLRDATGFTASHWIGLERYYRRRLAKWQEGLAEDKA